MIPGSVRPGTPTPPPHTPFQPGAPPLAPLPLWGAAAAGALALGKFLWDLLNGRPPGQERPPGDGDEFLAPGGQPVWITARWQYQQTYRDYYDCIFQVPVPSPPGSVGDPQTLRFFGLGIRAGASSGTNYLECSPDNSISKPPKTALYGIDKDGNLFDIAFVPGGNISGGGRFSGSGTGSLVGVGADFGSGMEDWGPIFTPGELLPEVAPELPTPEPLPEPEPLPKPARPLPAPLPVVVPETAPAPLPSRPPGGAPGPAPAPVRPPGVTPAPAPGPVQVPVTPAPLPVPPVGPLPIPRPPAVPTTPDDGLVVDGELVTGPGQPPAPNLEAIAKELGRLERKGELTLERLGPLANIGDKLAILQALAEWLLSTDPGTTYSIQPPCGTDANGNPLPPVEVIVPATVGPEAAMIARVDALAMLLDEHKSIRGPICRGKPTGRPVTVTFVEDLP